MTIGQNVTIRQAFSQDYEAMQALYRCSALSNVGDRAFLLNNPDYLMLAKDVNAHGLCWVAFNKDELLGFIACDAVDFQCWEIEFLFVAPSRFGQGIGRALLEHVIIQARNQGIETLNLLSNKTAENFYKSCGFSPRGLVKTDFSMARRMVMLLNSVQP